MKNRKVMKIAFVMIAFLIITGLVSVKAEDSLSSEKETVTTDYGFETKVSYINSTNVTNTEDYIKQNINENYTRNIKFEPADIIYVKHTLAEDSKLPVEKTINSMWEAGGEAYILTNESYMLMYDTDDNSEYYVALINTLRDTSSIHLTDITFAYTNTNGEVIEDAIYDANTGIAYIPKKYKEENKNGAGVLNVQVQMLQACDSATPVTSLKVIMNVAEDISGNIAATGIANLEVLSDEHAIKLALDSEALENIKSDYVLAYINGNETREFEYNEETGVFILKIAPASIDTLEISISKDNEQKNIEYRKEALSNIGSGIQAFGLGNNMEYAQVATWELSDYPTVGAYGIFEMYAHYDATPYTSEGLVVDCNAYGYGSASDSELKNLVSIIGDDNSIVTTDLVSKVTTWMSWYVSTGDWGGIYSTDSNQVDYYLPQGDVIYLKCVHVSSALGDIGTSADAMQVRYKVLDVSQEENYMVVGLLTPESHTQSGAGLFKVRISVPPKKGNLKIVKKDYYGQVKEGADFHIWGPGGEWWLTTDGNGEINLNDIEQGTYSIEETKAPNGMSNPEEGRVQTVEVTPSATATYERTNPYQRGSATLTKYDDSKQIGEKPDGSATLAGAVFELRAAETIKEGNITLFNENDVVATVTTDENGNTPTIKNVTSTVGDYSLDGLPIGKYYYIETKASPGFNINSNKVEFSIDARDQYYSTAEEKSNVVAETKKTVNIKINKKLGATDLDPEINLSGVEFTAVCAEDGKSYVSNTSGTDGICEIKGLPTGTYTISETKTPPEAYKVGDFTLVVPTDIDDGHTYTYTGDNKVVDNPKDMDIDITKIIKVADVEATDAKVEGAVFTIYKDEACTTPYKDKNGNVVTIGPTDANGYAKSQKMRTGTYYLKETTFPEGIDPDATISGENTTYRNKVYVASADNRTQGEDTIHLHFTITNEPIRNDIELWKIGEATSNTDEYPLVGAEFTATLISTIGTDHEYSVRCTNPTDENGYCIIKNLPYGDYRIEETKVPVIALKCSDFSIFVKEDRKVRESYKAADAETRWSEVHPERDWANPNNEIVDDMKKMTIKVKKVDIDGYGKEAPDYTQGDATLKGAIYDIWRYDPQTDDYTEYTDSMTVLARDEDGYWYAEYKDLITGKYKVVERVKSTDAHGNKYSYAEGYLVDEEIHYFDQDPATQEQERVNKEDVSKETVERGTVKVVKQDNVGGHTEDVPSAGAILKLTLKSTVGTENEIYYTAKIDKYGQAEFIDTNDEYHTTSVKTCYGYKYLPYTIPYGTYVITEIDPEDGEYPKSHTVWYINGSKYGETVEINTQDKTLSYIMTDNPIPVRLLIQKIDADTNQPVALPNATFKVWDCQLGRFVNQMLGDGSGEYIEEFKTNNEGYLELPRTVEAGDYILYEVDAPEGYYLEDKYRQPKDENGNIETSKLGNETYGGVKFTIDKDALKLESDATTPEDYYVENVGVYFTMKSLDQPLKTQIKLYKHGLKYTDIKQESNELTNDTYEETKTVYTDVPMEGATFRITALEDIRSKDQSQIYVHKGDKWEITTGEDGYVTSPELYQGKYRIEEIVTPTGYKTAEPFEIELTNDNQYERVKLYELEIEDKYQEVDVLLQKIFEKTADTTDVMYKAEGENEDEKEIYAVLGVFANEDITNIYGTKTIRKDTLIEAVEIKDGEDAHISAWLPDGKYYVQELYTSSPYIVDGTKHEFEVVHNPLDHTSDKIKVEVESIENWPVTTSLRIVKVSSTSIMQYNDLVLNSNETDDENIKAILDKYSEEMNNKIAKGEITVEDILNELIDNDIRLLGSAEYEVYVDSKCEKHLQKSEDGGRTYTNVILTSQTKVDEDGKITYTGLYTLDGIPEGAYYIKEVKAPKYIDSEGNIREYKVSEDVTKVDASSLSYYTERVAFRVVSDSAVEYEIDKTDIFTDKGVPDCLFTITDEDGKELLKFITNENGEANIPTDIFEDEKYYYFTEIEAGNPYFYTEDGKLYELNTEPHKFQAHVDEEGKWKLADIDEDGNEVVYDKVEIFNYRPSSIVTLTKLDMMDSTPVPNCKFELKSLETDWVVEGVTDENGIYVFENVPYGKYTYTELEAPEEYLIDTTPHEIEINAEDVKITVYDLKAPDTGDIQIITISVIGMLCIVGIVFITIKNKRKVNNI